MSPAFYKGKMETMVEIAKTCVQKTLNHWHDLSRGVNPVEIDFMELVQDMHVSIMLKCAFGVDVSQELIEYEHKGKVGKHSVSFAIRTSFQDTLGRMADPHVTMFPVLADVYITPNERAILRNCRIVR